MIKSMTTSFTEENYLKTIYHLQQQLNNSVSTNSISEALQTKAASVTDMLKKLADKNLINYEKYQGVTLTHQGQKKALSIIRKHRLWEVFLVEKLNFKWDEVHEVAEELEHIHSEKLINRLDEFLDFPEYDPHGDPIPNSKGEIKPIKLLPLNSLEIGEEGIISGVVSNTKEFLQYLDKVDLLLGTKVTIIDKIAFDGSLVILINNTEKNISKEVAKNLLIA
jgi:DtxR family Mn-dependent transcriptional regulator